MTYCRPSKEGFDIVIGNPPYGAKYDNQTKRYYKNTYVTANSIRGLQKGSLDTYTLFIELGYNLLRRNGSFAYIVPISLTSSDSLTGIHRIIMGNCDTIHISSYAVRPKPVFENAVVNTSILLFKKTETSCQHLFSTKMHRRGNEFELQRLIDNLNFVDVNGYTMIGRIPKIGSEMEKDILTKIFKNTPIKTLYDDKGEPIYYRTTGGRYFKVVTNYPTGSTKEKPLYFQKRISNAIGCILSSSLAFWFYQIYSNNLDWKTYEIENFTIPQLSTKDIEYLNKLYSLYLSDIEAKANIRTTSGESTYNVDSFKEYKIVRSKAIIDEIDDYICPLYGLTQKENGFIKNYELEFRLAGE
ncbi:Eco57I restriction-modification methylase domain-containing protein [Parabacteroides goldsteinii]|uniref:Eco57I restriction-modification methylase domain-containing protein n=1 Tax=Parabacteroides goldsteinii TaxID=328812 RepID=UPI00259B3421|nr:Eco57I restriction-modification methylase domain-containing protein [Parabacteroides goldsteinii]